MCVFRLIMRAHKTPVVVVIVAYPASMPLVTLVTPRVRFWRRPCVNATHTKDDIDAIL
jgi:antibiotic biosynthesis monooxygenase (ABM) superfamily enzyme